MREIQQRIVDAADWQSIGIAAGHSGCFFEHRFHVTSMGNDASVERHDKFADMVGKHFRIVLRPPHILLLLTFLRSQRMDARFSFDNIGRCHTTHLSATVPAALESTIATSFRAWRQTVSDQIIFDYPPTA